MPTSTLRAHRRARPFAVAVLALCALVAACATISPFSAVAYQQATALKAESLLLMDQATERFDLHKEAADRLRLELAKAYEFAKGRPLNEDSTRQWAILRDPKRNSIAGFLQRWQAEKELGRAFIDESKRLVADGFDAVIGLESGKRRE